MDRWEYKILEQNYQARFLSENTWEPAIDFDQLGGKGWELVSVIHIPGVEGQKYQIRYYFKRKTGY